MRRPSLGTPAVQRPSQHDPPGRVRHHPSPTPADRPSQTRRPSPRSHATRRLGWAVTSSVRASTQVWGRRPAPTALDLAVFSAIHAGIGVAHALLVHGMRSQRCDATHKYRTCRVGPVLDGEDDARHEERPRKLFGIPMGGAPDPADGGWMFPPSSHYVAGSRGDRCVSYPAGRAHAHRMGRDARRLRERRDPSPGGWLHHQAELQKRERPYERARFCSRSILGRSRQPSTAHVASWRRLRRHSRRARSTSIAPRPWSPRRPYPRRSWTAKSRPSSPPRQLSPRRRRRRNGPSSTSSGPR